MPGLVPGISGRILRQMGGWVYIVTNKPDGTLYIGVTADLPRRLAEHRSRSVAGFTKRYNLTRLVYAEPFDDIRLAIQREKTMKGWSREWKINAIVERNPDRADLSADV